MPETRKDVKSDKVRQPKIKSQKKTQIHLFDASIADGFLFMAMGDLDASVQLYHRGHYPQAIFLLQQSVEKSAKSLGIFLSLITDKDASKVVGHKPLNILRKTTNDMADNIHAMNKEIQVNPDIQKFLTGMGFDISVFDTKIDTWIEQAFAELKKMEEYDLNRQQIRIIIMDIRKRTEQTDIQLTNYRDKGLSEEDYDKIKKILVDMVISGINAMTLSPSEKKELIDDFQQNTLCLFMPDKENMEFLIIFFLVLVDCANLLITLAQLTAPHAIRSRYPMPDEGFDPNTYYTKLCPIVAALPTLYLFARRSIEQIDLLYDLMTGEGQGATATKYVEQILLDSKVNPA
jgi:hypothetical protein